MNAPPERNDSSSSIADWLALFIAPDSVTELRALHVPQRYGRAATIAGFFDGQHLAEMAAEVLRLTEKDKARGVYFTMNPLKPEILARCANRTKIAESGDLAADQHVAARRWLLIDIDPVRIAGISATDAEKAAALDVVNAIRQYLDGLGWPTPIVADSGNGWHLFYWIDLPGDDAGLVQQCLAALGQRFDSTKAKVDQSCFNPARIAKVPGTWGRKGDDTLDRPHRRGGITETPTHSLPVPRELVEALAAEIPPKASGTTSGKPAPANDPPERNGQAVHKHHLDVPMWLSARGVAFTVKAAKDNRNRTVFALDRCPFNPDHVESAIFQAEDGKLGFHCFHDSCAGRTWQDAKQAIGPPDRDHFDPPLPPKGDTDGDRKRPSQAEMLVKLIAGVELFHDSEGEAYATVPIGDHVETWPINSKGFRRWLSRLYFEENGKVPGAQALQDALTTIGGIAQHDKPEKPVAVRLAQHEDEIWLDLANSEWRSVRISADGWEVGQNPPVKFLRRRGMMPLPVPVKGGTLAALRPLINLPDENSWRLFVAWLVAAYRPGRPFPILAMNGEQGSAKTTACRMARALIDPNKAPLRRPPRDDRDLMIAATNGWVVAFDNLSGIKPDLADALCMLATGAGFGTRELYTNDEEKLFDATRPILINGIEDLATRSDLLDRSITLILPTIEDHQRMDEEEIWARFEQAQPGILGALLNAVSAALQNLTSVKLTSKPRMADFAKWVVAAEPALPWPASSFLTAYNANRGQANSTALEAAIIGGPIVALVDQRGRWQGTAGDLLNELEDYFTDEKTRKRKEWPGTPRKLGGDLRRLAPNLRKAGIDVTFDREPDKRRQRLIRLERTCNPSSTPSTSSETAQKTSQDGGRCADGVDDNGQCRPLDRPHENHGFSATSDELDGSDDVLQGHSKGDWGEL